MPELRTFVSRAPGFAGIQRYAANWLGDNQSRWDHLWLSMPMAWGSAYPGQPFVGADVGGFQGDTNAELFLRWMQYGTLTPFCRNHSEIGNVDQYAWAWGDVVLEPRPRGDPRFATGSCPTSTRRSCAPSRPARRSSGRWSSTTSTTRLVRDLDDEYLLGPDLLVAPVHQPRADRAPGLPARRRLVRLAHRRASPGGRFVVAPTPMDRIPLYARGGAVIPMWPEAPPSTAGHHPEAIELHLFVPRGDGDATARSCRRTTASPPPRSTARGSARRSPSPAAATA